MMYGYGVVAMILYLVITVAVIIGLVLLIVWVVRRTAGGNFGMGMQTKGNLSAKEIAQERYARGEISREEYQQIISDLDH